MARAKPSTPPVVARLGWRDRARTGDPCEGCAGWGCLTRLVGEGGDRRAEHQTCADCGGTGRAPKKT